LDFHQTLLNLNTVYNITKLQFHPTGTFYLALTYRATFYLIECQKKHKVLLNFTYPDKNQNIIDGCFTANGEEVIIAFKNGFSVYYIQRKNQKKFNLRDIDNQISKLAVSKKEQDVFAFIENETSVSIYSQSTKQYLSQLTANVKLNDMQFSPDSNFLYGAGKGEIYVWDVRSFLCCARYTDYGNINTVALCNCPNGLYQVTGSEYGIINLYAIENNFSNTNQPKPLKEFHNLTTSITSFSFSHDSQLCCVVSNSKSGSIRIINLNTRTVYRNFPIQPFPEDTINCCLFSPKSDYLIVGTNGWLRSYKIHYYVDRNKEVQ